MRFGASFAHELVTHLGRERKVGEVIAVEMTELNFPQTELGAAVSVRMSLHPVPAEERSLDGMACSLHIGPNTSKRPAISVTDEFSPSRRSNG
jgi:hypothetical protein